MEEQKGNLYPQLGQRETQKFSHFQQKQTRLVPFGIILLLFLVLSFTVCFSQQNQQTQQPAAGCCVFFSQQNRQTQQAAGGSLPSIGGCRVFPSDNVWNYDISHLTVDPNSTNYVNAIGANTPLYLNPHFPYIVVPSSQPMVPIHFTAYGNESDPGPYPIPANAPIEAQYDNHVIVIQSGTCKLYELWAAAPQANGSCNTGTGAEFDLNSNNLRPSGWTSADAAGLPMLPGLLRYDEIAAGSINHALRFSVPATQWSYLCPARHIASNCSNNPNNPPMGLRFRLRASVDISSFSTANQIILTALKKYAMFVADNYCTIQYPGPLPSAALDNRWNTNDLSNLGKIHGSDFEAVDESGLQVSPNSAQVSNPIAEARGLPQASAKTCICWASRPGWHVHYADQLTRASGKR